MRSRWSASAWLLLRDDAPVPLAPGSTLGGSQYGARLRYRLAGEGSGTIAFYVRASGALRTRADEAAVGIEWQPLASVPVHLAFEQRVAVRGAARTDLAVLAYGGGSVPVAGRARLDLYAQAGVVGLEERDAFADGAARLLVPVAGPVEIGAGIWGGAQPGAARLDAGPSLSVPFRIGRASLRASADWRFRVAGDARPDSGPAITIGADF